ncbi:MAG: VWA domain-containing protein [Candidatus Riflebacteria bacterium]|nr:VWA domain-containing protein [Candidatus Riflebacteria bacterium]
MYYLRRLLLAVMLVNISFLFLYHAVPAAWGIATQTPTDDWQYEMPQYDAPADPIESLSDGPYYILGIWMALEVLRALTFLRWGADAVVVVLVISVLASVAGPMVGSITDQGRGSIRDFGFSAGGAKDINNFRANIAAGCLPQPSDVTYEGLFYDYCFDTGKPANTEQSDTKRLFLPTWSSAVSKNPLTGKIEHFLAVGLKSELSANEFARKKLNLVVVLDISGSMSSPFNRYYYGSKRERPDMNNESVNMTKLESACSSIVAMLDHLRPDDRLGIVLFNHEAHLAKPVALISATDIVALKKHILELAPSGSTDMEVGLEMGNQLLSPFILNNPNEYENRMVFLTDAMPNTDDISESGLLDITCKMADHRIYTTFIGMGIDFNSQLIKSISKVRGANYYSVHSPVDFKKRLAEEFEFMVTPMIFDLTLTLKAPGYRIKEVIGSPEADAATGRIMQVKTLFPSPTDESGTRGGIILLQLEKLGDDPQLTLTVNYEDRLGHDAEVAGTFAFSTSEPEHFDDAGIRKGVLLTRYAGLIRDSATGKHKRVGPASDQSDGSGWSYWERPARSLTVSAVAQPDISKFCDHLQLEMAAIGDNTLEKEVRVLNQLSLLVQNITVSE